MKVMMLNRIHIDKKVYPAGEVAEINDSVARRLIAQKAAAVYTGTDEPKELTDADTLDYDSMTPEELFAELMKKTKPDLQKILADAEVQFGSRDNKDVLANLILEEAGKDPVGE